MRRKSRSKKFPAEFSTAPASSGACAPDIRRLHGIVRSMLADQWCETTWRAQPGSFVSLMTLYESNFVRLGWLVERPARGHRAARVSTCASDCDLHLTPLELVPLYQCVPSHIRVRMRRRRRSAILIWKCACIMMHGWPKCAAFADSSAIRSSRCCKSGLKRELDQRWTRNMMLNKWLEYCAERGHHF